MVRIVSNLIFLLAVTCLPLIGGCANKPTVVAGGTSTETVIGKIVNPDGSPAVGTVVYLRPSDYLPAISAKISARLSLKTLDPTITDSLGNFSFDSIASGTYTLECLDGEVGNGVLIDSVVIDNPGSALELATDTLKPLGRINGQIQFPESLDISQIRVAVYGLDRIAVPDSAGDYAISGLAEGRYSLYVQILGDQGMDVDNVVAVSDSTTWAPKTVLPGADKIYAPRASGAITVDGTFDEADWSTASEIKFSSPAYSDNLVRVRALWDSLFLYVAFLVKDSLVSPLLPDTLWNGGMQMFDAVELFLDPEHDTTPVVTQSDRQVVAYTTGQKLYYEGGTETSPVEPISCIVGRMTGSFSVEIGIPWTVVGTSPVEGLTMGALFTNWDRDAGFVHFDWLGIRYQANGTFKRPNLWGDLILTP